jgi:hypothetical protein
VLCYSPPTFQFSAVVGRNPSRPPLLIWNCDGGSKVGWTLSDDADWLTLIPDNGTLNGELDETIVVINSASMEPGVYYATVTVSMPGAINTPKYVPVSLEIAPQGCEGPPGTPTNLTAVADASWGCEYGTRFWIELRWQDNSGNEEFFEIERRVDDGPFGVIATTDVIPYKDYEVSEGVAYEYRVRAGNACGYSGYSNTASDIATGEGGGGCFIATAAYGSFMNSEVETLRAFRDEYLKSGGVGKGFVSTYYRVSPAVAEFIDEHGVMKPVVRVGLIPAVAVSRMAVSTTMTWKLVIVGGLLMASMAAGLVMMRAQGHKRAIDRGELGPW